MGDLGEKSRKCVDVLLGKKKRPLKEDRRVWARKGREDNQSVKTFVSLFEENTRAEERKKLDAAREEKGLPNESPRRQEVSRREKGRWKGRAHICGKKKIAWGKT